MTVSGECARCLEPLSFDREVDIQELYAYPDTDSRGRVVESADADDDNDSIATIVELNWKDSDSDGVMNYLDKDDDNDLSPDVLDCAPKDPAIHPGALELCNGIDDNCSGAIDEGFDADGDGFTDPGPARATCLRLALQAQ